MTPTARIRVLATLLLAGCGGAIPDKSAYRLQIIGAAPAPTVGQSSRLALRVERRDGTRIERFDLLHGENMHLFQVSSDLQELKHVHPEAGSDGEVVATVGFERPTPYALFGEFVPAGEGGETHVARASVWPTGAVFASSNQLDATTAFDGLATREALVPEARVTLHAIGTPLRAQQAVALTFTVRDPGGVPVHLALLDGAPLNVIAVSEGTRELIHGRGMYASSDPSGPRLELETTFPRTGLYRLWVQLRRWDRVITIPFVVRVA